MRKNAHFLRNPDFSFNDRLDLNRLVILKKERARQPQHADVLDPEIAKLQESLSNKYKNLDNMVDKVDKIYTKDAKEFGEKWIYGKEGDINKYLRTYITVLTMSSFLLFLFFSGPYGTSIRS